MIIILSELLNFAILLATMLEGSYIKCVHSNFVTKFLRSQPVLKSSLFMAM